MTDPPKLRSKAPAIAAGGLATLTASYLLSFLGTVGTATGLVIGSVSTGTFSTLYENWIKRGHEAAKSRLKGAHESQEEFEKRVLAETSFIPPVKDEDSERSIPWKAIAITSAGALGSAILIFAGMVLLAGKPVSTIGNVGPVTTGRHNNPPAVEPSAPPTESATPTQHHSSTPVPTTQDPSSTPVPTVTPTATASPTPTATRRLSATPTVTVTVTPSATASVPAPGTTAR